VVAALLLAAASLKANALFSGFELGSQLAQLSLVLIVAIEIAFALWSLIGAYPIILRTCLIGLFSGFFGYSILAFSYGSSCNCFGTQSIGPIFSSTLDLLIVVALSASHADDCGREGLGCKRGAIFFVIFCSASVGAAALLLTDHMRQVGSSGFSTAGIRPGSQLPLLNQVDLGPDLAQGRWRIVLYHHDCTKCQLLIDTIVPPGESIESVFIRNFERHVALIELPPFADSVRWPTNSVCVHGHFQPDSSDIISTPLELYLQDGVVMQAGL